MKTLAILVAGICAAFASSAVAGAPRLPDLIVSDQTAAPGQGGVYTLTHDWDPTNPYTGDACDVAEGLISSAGVHRILVFPAGSTNVGAADLFIGNPAHDDRYVYSACHDHWHFNGYARYRLLDLNGVQVGASNKVGFCIIDSWPPDNWDPNDPQTRQRFKDCDHQGLSVGWSDIYSATLHGQWIEIDGVPPGSYVLEVTVNWQHILAESDYTNNTATFPVTIGTEDGPATNDEAALLAFLGKLKDLLT